MPRDPIATLPNLISLSRLAMAVAFPFVTASYGRVLLVAAAGATDFLDGYLARRRGSATRLGAMIDPAADRGFMLVAVAVLWYDTTLSGGAALVLIARDAIVLGAWVLTRRSARLRDFGFTARPAGKVVTVVQLVTLACALVAPAWLTVAVVAVALTTVVALSDYTLAIRRGSAGLGAALILAMSAAGVIQAQSFRIAPFVQPEASAGALIGGAGATVVGAGINVPVGYYVRVSPGIAAGPAFGNDRSMLVRGEIVARFLFDPFRQARWAPYAGGGVAGTWHNGAAGRAALLVVVGLDFPGAGRWQPAVEAGLGGGVRISGVVRRSRSRGR